MLDGKYVKTFYPGSHIMLPRALLSQCPITDFTDVKRYQGAYIAAYNMACYGGWECKWAAMPTVNGAYDTIAEDDVAYVVINSIIYDFGNNDYFVLLLRILLKCYPCPEECVSVEDYAKHFGSNTEALFKEYMGYVQYEITGEDSCLAQNTYIRNLL